MPTELLHFQILPKANIRVMKKRQSSSSSVEDSPQAQVQLAVTKKEPRTRSRYKLDYHPKDRDSNRGSNYQHEPQAKKEIKIDRRYLVETKEDLEHRPLKKHEEENIGLIKQQQLQTKSQAPVKISTYESEIGAENIKLLTEAEKTSVDLISQMNSAYKQDIKAFLSKKLAYHKVKLLSTISQTLENVLTRTKFLELGGLQEFYKWLLPIEDRKGRWVEPSLAVKMGVLRIIGDLRLSKEELKSYAVNVHKVVFKNMSASKIPQLKQACAALMKIWDYTIYKQTGPAQKRK